MPDNQKEKLIQEPKQGKKGKGKWLFLLVVLVAYLSIFLISIPQALVISRFFVKLLKQILPIFLLVYVVMLLTNYFVNNKTLRKWMGEEAGIKGWFISIVTGIISMGPIYMWYPLMKDLQAKGVKNKFLATFLYNRGIKLPWVPMLVIYFGWIYSIVLLLVMAILSIPQGMITEKIMGHKKSL